MTARFTFIVALMCSLGFFAAYGQNRRGVLDLTTLFNYANQTKPTYITKDNTTAGNSITDKGATLGRVLFYDKRLSRYDTIACASCHKQSLAFGDSVTASTGVAGTTGRHAMRLVNARFGTEVKFFWDERAATTEDQTTRPIKDHTEMGFSGTSGDPAIADLLVKLAAIPEYKVLFALVYGDAAVTEARLQLALAQFVRSIQSFDSKFDVGRAQVNANNVAFPNFTASENNGKALFINPPGPGGGAGCAGCHRPPEFDIDPNSLNNGVTTKIGGGTDLTNTRSPSLRDIAGPGGVLNGGLMHDGSFTTIGAVINHYNAIPADNTNLDNRLRRPGGGLQNLNLTQQQRNDLGAFLLTLTGSAVYTDERWSDPFDASGTLSVIVLPSSSTTISAPTAGVATVSARGAVGMQYTLQTSSNLSSWDNVTTLTPDSNGNMSHPVSVGGTQFYRFVYVSP